MTGALCHGRVLGQNDEEEAGDSAVTKRSTLEVQAGIWSGEIGARTSRGGTGSPDSGPR